MSGSRAWGARITRDGAAFLTFTLALSVVAWLSRDNLLYLVVATLWAVGLVGGLGAVGAVRGLVLARELPDEVFVGYPAAGRWRVSRRMAWPALDLVVDEPGVGAHARVAHVPGRARVEVPATWRFSRRGRVRLDLVRIRSRAPLGLLEVWRELHLPAELWVWPRPTRPAAVVPDERGATRHSAAEPDALEHLRPYRPGDRPRDLHWPTSARRGQAMVVVRGGSEPEPVWVEVPAEQGAALEEAVSAAAAAVLAAVAARRPVGLRMAGRVWPPRTGAAWRRELLTALAAVGTS